ncbi:MAG: hypothetical protein PHH82_02085 [Candidatus ainarchaeum sp.]|nr:hypothetical protein [Candidatus ainarchaeum sp.]
MVLKELRDWNTKRRIKSSKELSLFAIQHARRILEQRRPELLQELRKTTREEVIKHGNGKGFTLVSVGQKRTFDPIRYTHADDYHLEVGHAGDVANFTYKKIGRVMLFSDLAVGRYHRESNLRRLGIAKLMVDIAKEIAQREGLTSIRISTEKKPWLKDMYEKFGFLTLSRAPNGATEMVYIFDKAIRDKFDPRDPYAILKYLR